jgi:hypothetical protein
VRAESRELKVEGPAWSDDGTILKLRADSQSWLTCSLGGGEGGVVVRVNFDPVTGESHLHQYNTLLAAAWAWGMEC